MDDDADFVDRAVARLPAVPLPPRLNRHILAAYDARQRGLWRRLSELIWPGAPSWAPASAFAAALLAGVALGTVLPTASDDGMRFSLDQPASFSLVPADLEEDL